MISRPSFDPRSLALFRIALGVMLLVDLAVRALDLSAHYSDAGIFPREAFALVDRFFSRGETPIWVWSLHALHGSVLWVGFLFIIQAVLGLLFIWGWRTRIVHILCWVLLVSLQSRNPLIIYGADHVLRLLFFFSIFLPLGSCWSLDARVGRGQVRAHPLAVLAFTLQLAMLYGFSFLLKSDAAWRSDFTAALMALKIDFYVTEWGRWLTQYPEGLRVLTASVVGLEAMAPLLLVLSLFIPRLRWPTVVLYGGLQLGFALCFHLGFFPWISMIAVLPFIPWLKKRPLPKGDHCVSGVCAVISIVLVAWLNANSLPERRVLDWPILHRVTEVLRLDQSWGLFAPYPLTDDGWFVLAADFESGESINLLNSGGDVLGAKPLNYAASFPNHRWRKFFLRLRREDGDPFVPYLLDWMALHPKYFGAVLSTEIHSLQLTFYQEITGFDGLEYQPEAYVLGQLKVPAYGVK